MSAFLPPPLSLEQARAALLAGGLVLFPTETVYGLGCDCFNAEAVAAVFLLKKRSPSMPLPLAAASREQIAQVAYSPPSGAEALMDRFWPGPLTLLLPARPSLPELLTAHTRRIAVRHSSHPAVQSLCRALGRPLVATSANISGLPSADRKEDLDSAVLAGSSGLYLEGPEPAGGPPSSLAEVSESRGRVLVRLLRAGAVSAEALRAAGFEVTESKHKRPLKK